MTADRVKMRHSSLLMILHIKRKNYEREKVHSAAH